MPYDLNRLSSYVRFYLTVTKQLEAAWDNLERAHGVVKDALAPFAGPLGEVGSPALAVALGPAPEARASLEALFRPLDEEGLTGLTDIYEVVGRFSFQGDGDDNLARVQALVSGARNEIVEARLRLSDLALLPEAARSGAGKLAATEQGRSGALRASRTAAFEPLADQVQMRARQTMDAIRAVPSPDLAGADTASEEYKRYAAKVDQVYQTCLPFLRKSITALYVFAGCEATATWPDSLPLTRELPAELVTVPPADSPELSQARATLRALADEEIQLGRARDEIATTIARFEGEMGAGALHDKELEVEIATTTRIVDYLTTVEAAQSSRQTLAALEAQKAQRVQAGGAAWQRHQQIKTGIDHLDEELVRRAAEIEASLEALAAEKKNEPVLFGKDEWRMRVAALEAQVENQRAAHAQRLGVLGGLRIDLSSVAVQVQTEQQHATLVDRQLATERATLEALTRNQHELATVLGSQRPARPVPVPDAREAVASLQQARLANGQRQEQLRAEVRRQKEETVRVLIRLKQIGVEREQAQAMVQSAQVAATEGHEGALRHLAKQRKEAVDRHVGEVLGTLEKSLAMVGPVFVEPARKVMLDATEARAEASAGLVEAAEKLGPVVEKLARELDAELLAADAGLGQIQREFCDVAPGACHAAWS